MVDFTKHAYGSYPGGPVVFDAASNAIFASFTTPPSDARKLAINSLVTSLKTNNIWDSLDLLYLTAAADSQAARINWKNPGTFTATAVNTPTFTTDRGYAGNGTNARLETGWIPFINGVNYTLNSCSIWVYSRTTGQLATHDIGALTSLIDCRTASNTTAYRLNDSGAGASGTTITDGIGFFGAQRTSSTAVSSWRNGASTGTASVTSVALSALNQYICAANSASFSTREISVAAFGAALTGKESSFYNAILAYLQNVGAA